jgi:hypothetical protein
VKPVNEKQYVCHAHIEHIIGSRMIVPFLKRTYFAFQEKRGIVRRARSRIGELLGSDKVVEIGCGFGANSTYCKGDYLGIDANPAAVEEAKMLFPDKKFISGDVSSQLHEIEKYDTLLFCAVLHEIYDRITVLNILKNADLDRIFICDYSPQLGGWLRGWLDVFEPEIRSWWNCSPTDFFPDKDWTSESGQISKSLLYWDFRRK